MKKTKRKKEKKFDFFIIIMTITMFLLLVIWIIKDNYMQDNYEDQTIIEQIGTDVFNKINISEALQLIKSDDLTFIYIGYEGCNACDKFVPKLAEVSESFDMTVNYINFKEIDKNLKEWTTFTSKLTKKVELSIKKDERTITETKTIGQFLVDNGYTPTFVVLKSGKIVDGNIGAMTKTKLKQFLEAVGFKKTVDF